MGATGLGACGRQSGRGKLILGQSIGIDKTNTFQLKKKCSSIKSVDTTF